jgi:hypothetical protein
MGKKPVGWRNDRPEHSLAARGISTKISEPKTEMHNIQSRGTKIFSEDDKIIRAGLIAGLKNFGLPADSGVRCVAGDADGLSYKKILPYLEKYDIDPSDYERIEKDTGLIWKKPEIVEMSAKEFQDIEVEERGQLEDWSQSFMSDVGYFFDMDGNVSPAVDGPIDAFKNGVKLYDGKYLLMHISGCDSDTLYKLRWNYNDENDYRNHLMLLEKREKDIDIANESIDERWEIYEALQNKLKHTLTDEDLIKEGWVKTDKIIPDTRIFKYGDEEIDFYWKKGDEETHSDYIKKNIIGKKIIKDKCDIDTHALSVERKENEKRIREEFKNKYQR